MHEMSIAESILQLIEDAACAQKFTQVKVVRLEIGQLASIEQSSLMFCFDAVTRDSVAEGAQLEIVAIVGQGWCMQCATTVNVATWPNSCPICGSFQLQITSGDEMRVKELEVE
jgi:hydrogenase nickel incorporation protein HypA/HybF